MLLVCVIEETTIFSSYSGTSLIRTPLVQKNVSSLVRCPDFRGCNVHKQSVWDSEMCPVYRGVLISGVVMYTNRVFGTAKCVLFIDRGVLISGCPN